MTWSFVGECQDGQSGKTPLHYAIEKRNVELVRRLLELAVTTRRSTTTGRCLSMEAAMLAARTGTDNAALHLAVTVRHMAPYDQRRLVQLLLSKGADPSARNGEGKLPREMTNDNEVSLCDGGVETRAQRNNCARLLTLLAR